MIGFLHMRGLFKRGSLVMIAMVLGSHVLHSQDTIQICTIKNGQQYVWLTKNIAEPELDRFIRQFSLEGLALRRFIQSGYTDSIILAGWKIGLNNASQFTLFKPLEGWEEPTDPVSRMLLHEKDLSFQARFPRISDLWVYGANQFRNKSPFAIRPDSTVLFFLKGQLNAVQVALAGSFNDWDPSSRPMVKTDSGWVLAVKLLPGKYWYKFVVDGKWMIDKDNVHQENDGQGNTNSIFFVTNHQFRLSGFGHARKVAVAGSFNQWNTQELALVKNGADWVLPVYLSQGTHTYRFVVDGQWMEDPANTNHFPNEFGEYNSVLYLGTPIPFELKGHLDAQKVILSGSFNQWKDYELVMTKTSEGWVLPYVLGPGNHEYKFLVDGKPDEERTHVLIISPNYSFRTSAFAGAKSVYLTGDFNQWSTTMLPMKREGNEWVATIHLSKGKHRYKFLVDGKWMRDPNNKLYEGGEKGNSVIWVE